MIFQAFDSEAVQLFVKLTWTPIRSSVFGLVMDCGEDSWYGTPKRNCKCG